mmetsp:Transcript_20551/g.28318  ORF Transcript_20551/g.28318 Transcript_20551/m.28318 type:complete len:169 (-) Transcript_20551:343-849(-)|eukprot:CAMPEP_0170069162 /NCGR_PEP_ID=MMETSP0019_2-20121128/7922_1 /TAXON_ID=98059 /ORGANISM="Dinobryon sp., Strain UTEXLB2267" /LENGTH=168 /DNA_ID=CAMNT_0010277101 /DNA_START=98 /DNA_END=604 /DNA_ORIENTATION=+
MINFDTSSRASTTETLKGRKKQPFDVGDVVRVKNPGPNVGINNEGVIVERLTDGIIRVDFGDYSDFYEISRCELILRSQEYEIGDIVKMIPPGRTIYFAGKIVSVNEDNTLDILMDGDDPEDIEKSVNKVNVTKVMTRRALVIGRWRSAVAAVIAVNSMIRTNDIKHR